MKILLIDDHKMFREGITMFLTNQRDSWNIISCESIEHGLLKLQENDFDIIVSDLNLPGKNVQDLCEYLTNNKKEIPILVLSMDAQISNLIAVLKGGVKGYISKESSSFHVVKSIESIVNGEYSFGPVLLQEMVKSIVDKSEFSNKTVNKTLDLLSKRETEIFNLLSKNSDLNDIAKTLFISKKTVENHRSSIYKKLGVHDRFSLQEFRSLNNII